MEAQLFRERKPVMRARLPRTQTSLSNLALHHQSLACHSRFALTSAKNEASKEEAEIEGHYWTAVIGIARGIRIWELLPHTFSSKNDYFGRIAYSQNDNTLNPSISLEMSGGLLFPTHTQKKRIKKLIWKKHPKLSALQSKELKIGVWGPIYMEVGDSR